MSLLIHRLLKSIINLNLFMMKKITLLLFAFLTVSFGYSQSLPIDFTDALDNNFVGVGGSVYNADVSPTNGSNAVGKIIGGIVQWDSRIDLALDTYIDMTTANKTFTFEFYTTEAVVMTGLFQIGNEEVGGFPIEMQFTTDGNIGWQTITLDFIDADNGYPNCQGCPSPQPVVYGQYAQVSVFTNFGDTGTSTYYVDDIAGAANGTAVVIQESCSDGIMNQDETGVDCGGVCAPCAAPPAIAAPTPPIRDAADVISIYSDAYTNVTIDDFDLGLCGVSPAVAEETIGGNLTQHYLGAGCQGISIENNRIDVSQFKRLHFDFFTDETDLIGKVFNIKLVDWAGNPTEAGSTGLEVNFNNGTSPAIVTGSWVSVDVDISAISGLVSGNLTRSDIAEIHITSNLPNAWYDNIYFYDKITPGTCSDGIMNQDETGIDCGGTISGCTPCTGPPTVAAPIPPNRVAADVISIYSDAYTDITIDDFDFGLCGSTPAASEVTISGNLTQNYLGAGCQGISMETNRIDASAFTHLHFDFFTNEVSLIGKVFNIKLVDWAGNPTEAGSTGLEVNFNDGTSPAIVTGSWVSVDVDITSLGGMIGGNLTRSDVAQIHITSNLPNAWYDNLYLHKNTTLGIKDYEIEGLTVYPNPTRNSWNISTKNEIINLIEIFNVLGKSVISLRPNSITVNIDASNLATGMYFSKISTDSGTSTRKLIKK